MGGTLADRPALSGKAPDVEMEITPAMIEAGVVAYQRFDEFYEPIAWGVCRIYEAVEKARVSSPCPPKAKSE